jgi:hypothetical protein
MTLNLSKIDTWLKRLAGLCLVLTGSSAAGAFKSETGILIGIFGVVCGFLATAPAFSPTNGSPLWQKICATIGGLAAAIGTCSIFPQFQALFSPGKAHAIAIWIVIVGQAAAFLAQSAAAEVAKGAAVMLLALLAFGSSGCATADAIAKDIKGCIQPQDAKLLGDAEQAFVSEVDGTLLCDPTLAPAALVVCAEDALPAACAAVGPDAEALELCIENAIENDPAAATQAKANAAKAKARAAKRHAMARARGGRS